MSWPWLLPGRCASRVAVVIPPRGEVGAAGLRPLRHTGGASRSSDSPSSAGRRRPEGDEARPPPPGGRRLAVEGRRPPPGGRRRATRAGRRHPAGDDSPSRAGRRRPASAGDDSVRRATRRSTRVLISGYSRRLESHGATNSHRLDICEAHPSCPRYLSCLCEGIPDNDTIHFLQVPNSWTEIVLDSNESLLK